LIFIKLGNEWDSAFLTSSTKLVLAINSIYYNGISNRLPHSSLTAEIKQSLSNVLRDHHQNIFPYPLWWQPPTEWENIVWEKNVNAASFTNDIAFKSEVETLIYRASQIE
jgi:hypothetical protein